MESRVTFIQKVYSKWQVLLFDTLAIPLSWFCAYGLRYNLHPFALPLMKPKFYWALFLLMGVQLTSYYVFRVYRGLWRFFSISDVNRIIRSVVLASSIVFPLYYMVSLTAIVPRSVYPLYCLILIMVLCSARLLRRSYWDSRVHCLSSNDLASRVLVIGAGRAGEGLIRDLKRTHLYNLVGIIDNDPNKIGLELHGVQVLGNSTHLPQLVLELKIELVFIAIPSASSSEMRSLVEWCEKSRVPFRTLPSLQALASGRVEVNALREVRIEDLLGRDQVELHWERISAGIQGKRVIVTGAGGSIGSELCRQIMMLNPDQLLLLDNSEFNLYAIEQELRQAFPNIPVQLALISVVDSVAVLYHLQAFKPEIVFHAAAFKHVPLLEHQIRVAMMNNILGTQVIAEASAAVGAEKFILISTDKAVNPTNVMGATKRVAEIFCQNLNKRVATQFITVRFGNVLGSVGSVVPLFKQQLKQGGPLTVTHPDIERFFMTIPEASQLILQAMASGNGGEIFVLDMGEPVKITYLAQQLIRLAGKEPGVDVEIKFTGLRPGEKLFEELFHESEQLIETEHEKLFKARVREVSWEELIDTIQLIKVACCENQTQELWVLLKSLVPEFRGGSMLEQSNSVATITSSSQA